MPGRYFKKNANMADCFQTIIGLSDRDCDCFKDGRPAGTIAAEDRQAWYTESFSCPEEPDTPFVITTRYDIPADHTPVSLQVYVDGVMIENDNDFTVDGDRTISIVSPTPGATYQVLYFANVDTAPAYSESKSGLYITDLLPEEEIAGLATCDQTLWALMSKARSVAISEFKAALNATMGQRYKVKYPTFKGFVGEDKGSDRLTTTKAIAGLRIRTAGLRSGYLRITRIMAMFQQTGTIQITIYKGRLIDESTGEMELEVAAPAFNITTVANGRSITTINLDLPLLGDFSQEQDYLITYQYDSGNKPVLNKLTCGCGGWKPIRNASMYKPHSVDRFGSALMGAWHNFIMIGGWEGDITSGTTTAPDQTSEYLNGLCLEIEAGCDMSKGLCGMVESFGANPYAMSVATAIQRKAAEYLVRKRLASSLPNRNTAVNREGLEKEAKTWAADFAEIVEYLSSNMPETSNDCLQCRPGVRMGSILS